MMTDQSLLALLWASAPLAAVNSFGTSGLGILAAWLAMNAPIGLLALVVPLLLLWISYDEQTSQAAEAQLYAELARLQERASGRSVDVSARVVLTAAARLFGSDDVEMVLMAGDGPVHYGGDGHGLTRRRVEREALDMPWVLRALGGNGVAAGTTTAGRGCATVLGGPTRRSPCSSRGDRPARRASAAGRRARRRAHAAGRVLAVDRGARRVARRGPRPGRGGRGRRTRAR